MTRFLPLKALERLEGLSPCRFQLTDLGRTLTCDGLEPKRYLALVSDGDVIMLPAVYRGLEPGELDFEFAVRHGIWRIAIYLFGDAYLAGVVLRDSHFENPREVYDFSVNFSLSRLLGLLSGVQRLILYPTHAGVDSAIFS